MVEDYVKRCRPSSSSRPSQRLNMHKMQRERASLTGSFFFIPYTNSQMDQAWNAIDFDNQSQYVMIWMLRNDSCRQDHLMYTNNMPQASGCVGQVNSIWRHSSTFVDLTSYGIIIMVTVINLGLPENPHMPCSIIIIIISINTFSLGSLAPTCGSSLLPPSSSIPCGSPSLEGQVLISSITIYGS